MSIEPEKQKSDRKILVLLLLIIVGYLPWGVPVLFLILGDLYDWGMEYWNETVAWAVILSVSHLIAAGVAVRLMKKHPDICGCVITLAVMGVGLSILAWTNLGFSPSSKADDPQLELLGFWLDGGWVVAAVLLVPTLALYAFATRARRRHLARSA